MQPLAVIIVTWNARNFIGDALRSLLIDFANSQIAAHVLVVDSASSDTTVEFVEQEFVGTVEVLALEENVGFARANNAGLVHLGFTSDTPIAPFVLLLNPDTITQQGATASLLSVMQSDKTIGMAGANLTYEDGSFQHGAFAFPGLRQLYSEFFWLPGRLIEGRFNGRYPRYLYQGKQPFDVDFVLGASMLLRANVIATTGMFDEQFFMYGEEVDWQWRIRKAGWRIVCVPTAHIVHLSGLGTSQVKARSVRNLWESRLRLYGKHYPRWKFIIAKRLLAWGMKRTLKRWQQQHGDPTIAEAYLYVIGLASQP